MKSCICFLFLLPLAAFAQTSWTGASDGITWDDAGNWNPASVPVLTTNVVIDVTPPVGLAGELYAADRVIGLTNAGSNTIQSLQFGSDLTDTVKIIPLSSETLQVNGSITNSSSFTNVFALPVYAGASATWTGPLTYANTVNINANTITLVGTHNFTGTDLDFTISNSTLAGYGHFVGSFTLNFSGTINIDATAYASSAVAGDTFDFTTGSFTGATFHPSSLPSLSSGLAWDTSNFISSGVLSVVSAIPEPSAYAAIFGAAAIGFGVWRKRRKA